MSLSLVPLGVRLSPSPRESLWEWRGPPMANRGSFLLLANSSLPLGGLRRSGRDQPLTLVGDSEGKMGSRDCSVLRRLGSINGWSEGPEILTSTVLEQ